MSLGYPTTSGSYESQQFGPVPPYVPGYFSQPAMFAEGAIVAWYEPYKGWPYFPHFHNGLDVAGPEGLALRALESGRIVHLGEGMIPGTDIPNGGGNVVSVEIRPGTRYTLNHCEGFPPSLREGDHVNRGQVIAYIGSTGIATGPHCHVSLDIDERGPDGLERRLPWNPKLFMEGGPFADDSRIRPITVVAKDPDMALLARMRVPADAGRLFSVRKGVTLRKGPGTNYPIHFVTTVPVKYRLVAFDNVNGADTGWIGAASTTNPRPGVFYVPPDH